MKETMKKFGAWLLAAALAFAGTAAMAAEATVTINGTPCDTLKDAFDAAKGIAGEITIAISAGTINTGNMDGFGNVANKKVTIKGAGMDATELLWTWPSGAGIGCAGAEVTFEDLALTINHQGYGMPYTQGLEHPKSQLYKNVKINGSITTMDDVTFDGCLFTGMLKDDGGNVVDEGAGKYSIWVYGGGVNFVDCTFKKTKNASIKLYGEKSNGIACCISGTTFESAGSKGSAIYASNENNVDKPIYEIYIDAKTKVEDGTELILPSGNGLSVINAVKDENGKITSGTFITANTDSSAVKEAIGKAVAEGVEVPELINGKVVIEGGEKPTAVAKVIDSEGNEKEYETLGAAFTAAKSGDTVELLAASYGENDLTDIGKLGNKNVTVVGLGMDMTELKVVYGGNASDVNGLHFQDLALTINHSGYGMPYTQTLCGTYERVKINGLIAVDHGTSSFKDCVFTGTTTGDEYILWQYGGYMLVEGCIFKASASKGVVKLYCESSYEAQNLVKDCIFLSVTGSKGCAIYASNSNNLEKPIYEMNIVGNTIPAGIAEYKASGDGLTVVNPVKDANGKFTSGTFISGNANKETVAGIVGAVLAENCAIVPSGDVWTVGVKITEETIVTTEPQESKVEVPTEVVQDEVVVEKIEQSTKVEGMKLSAAATEQKPAGIVAVVEEAKKNTEFAAAVAAAVEVSVKVEVEVKPTEYVAPTADKGKVAFKLTPKATVTVVQEEKKLEQVVPVTNDMIDQSEKIAVSIYTGFAPATITHDDDKGARIETFEGDQISYDAATGVATVLISHFSTLTSYGDAADVPPAKVYVAMIDETPYETLEEAVAVATKGQTVRLIADVTKTPVYLTDESILKDGVTLDLNGFSIPGCSVVVPEGGIAAIIGGTLGKALTFYGKGTLEISDVIAKGAINRMQGSVSLKTGSYANDPTSLLAPGYVATKNDDGTWTVQEMAPAVAKVIDAEGNEKGYETLAAAVSAAQDGETVMLLADVADVGTVSLKAGVTLEGGADKHVISGNSSVRVNAKGGTIRNVTFKDIHNDSMMSAKDCEYYNVASKEGTLSAIHYEGFTTADLTVTGCVFDNIDWDALQILPADKAIGEIAITENVFKHTDTTKSQLRYIHIQHMKNTDAYPVNVKLTITDNQFFNIDKSNLFDKSSKRVLIDTISIDSVNPVVGNTVNGNYMSDRSTINGGSITLQSFYPMRSVPDKDVDDLPFPLFNVGSETYATLAEAVAAANAKNADATISLNGDLVVDETVEICSGKSSAYITFNGNGHNIVANTTMFKVKSNLNFAGCSVSGTPCGLVTCPETDPLMVVESGKLTINSGIFTKDISDLLNTHLYYLETNAAGNYIPKQLNDTVAKENGYVAKTSSNPGGPYYKTLQELFGEKTTAYLMVNVSENVVATKNITIQRGENSFAGSITLSGEYNASIYCDATLTSLTCKQLNMGYNNNADSNEVTIEGGSIGNLNTSYPNCCHLILKGGTFGVDPRSDTYVAWVEIPENYEVVENATEPKTWTVQERAICQIVETGVKYPTLLAAFDAAGAGETVQLLVDVTSAMNEAYTVAKGKSITLDLNGKVLSGGNDKTTGFAYLTNNGTLTLKDSSAEGTGKITSKTYPDTGNCPGFHTVLNKGTFVMESGTIEEASEKVGGGNNLKWAFRNEASQNQKVSATIKGGLIVGNYNAISDYVYDDSSDCTLNIEGGVIKSTGRFSVVTLQSASASKPKLHINISGGEFIVENRINTNPNGNAIFYCDGQANANADFTGCFKITGGKFNTFNTPMIAEFTADAGTPTPDEKFMTAGLSKCVIPQESIADGYVCVSNPDEETKDAYPYKVQEPAVEEPIVIDIDPPEEGGKGETVPVVVTQDLVKEILGKEAAALTEAEKTQVVETLQATDEDGLKGWQKYAAGFKQTDKHPLAPKGRGGENGQLVLVTSLVAPKKMSLDTGVRVKYVLLTAPKESVDPATGLPPPEAFEPYPGLEPLDTPEFPVGVAGLEDETYWKIEVVYTATKAVEVPVESEE